MFSPNLREIRGGGSSVIISVDFDMDHGITLHDYGGPHFGKLLESKVTQGFPLLRLRSGGLGDHEAGDWTALLLAPFEMFCA